MSTLAHEFWIEPQEYQVQSGAPLIADIRNGQFFAGSSLVYFDKRTARFDMVSNGQVVAFQGRMGDVPALQTVAPQDGLLVIVHQTTESSVTYSQWEKFRNFATHKGFPEAIARHKTRGLPETGFNEVYTRYVKALIGVGSSKGADDVTGMETEFVALANPYTDDLTVGFPVMLLYRGAPRAQAMIEIFARSPDNMVSISKTHTDANGRAMIPVQTGYTYLLDAVILREPAADSTGVWESLWAAMTFAVP